MGDGGLQQLIIIGLFLLFGLADLIARVARGRTRSQQPGEPVRRPAEMEERPWQADMPWQGDDDEEEVVRRPVRDVPVPAHARVDERQKQRANERVRERANERVRERTNGRVQERVERVQERVERVQERVNAERGRPARERAVRDRTSSVRQDVVRSAPVRPVASRLASSGLSARDRMATSPSGRRARGLRFTADDARRGVIAMTVLGPCRALEDSERGL
jgi:hypothetical protein